MEINIEKDWITESGLRAVCLVVRNSHRCGYVGVPKEHPLHGLDYDAVCEKIPVEVHGGLTYSGNSKTYPAESDGLYWFGFDCAHYGDGFINESIRSYPGETVKSQAFVESECESLARQISIKPNEVRDGE